MPSLNIKYFHIYLSIIALSSTLILGTYTTPYAATPSGAPSISADAAAAQNDNAWHLTKTTRKLLITGITGGHRIVGEYGALDLDVTDGIPERFNAKSGNLYLAGILAGGTATTPELIFYGKPQTPEELEKTYAINIWPQNDQGSLFLENGFLSGNILLTPSPGNDVTLASSAPPQNVVNPLKPAPNAQVIIHGNIDMASSEYTNVTVEALNGVPLEVDGDIGHNGIPVPLVKASTGDVGVYKWSEVKSTGTLNAQNIVAANNHTMSADNVIVGSTIGNGSVLNNGTLTGRDGGVLLKGGVSQATGTISTTPYVESIPNPDGQSGTQVLHPGGPIISRSANDNTGVWQAINQGTGSLSVDSSSSVEAGSITVNSVIARDGDIIANTTGSTASDAGGNITASTVGADKGAVQAVNLTMPAVNGQQSNLHAKSLDLSGSLSFANGEFNLTGSSTIAGDVTITGAHGQEGGLGDLTVKGIFKVTDSDLSGPGDLHLGSVSLNGANLHATNLFMTDPLKASNMQNNSSLNGIDGNVYLLGGVSGASGEITASQNEGVSPAVAGNIYAYSQATQDNPTAGTPMPIDQGSNSLDLVATNNILAASITASSINSGKNTEILGSLNLTGPEASSVGGNLAIGDNSDSKVGDITVGGSMTAKGGSMTGDHVTAATAIFADNLKGKFTSFALGDSPDSSLQLGETPADNVELTIGTLNTANGSLNAIGGNVLIDNDFTGAAVTVGTGHWVKASGDISIKSVNLDNATLAGANVEIADLASMTDDSHVTATAGNVYLRGGASPASGTITANSGSSADSGSIYAIGSDGRPQTINQGTGILNLVASNDINSGNITAASISSGGNTNVEGSLNITGPGESSIKGDLAITNNADSSLGDLAIGNNFSVAGGNLAAGDLSARSGEFTDGVNVNANSFKLSAPAGIMQVGANDADNVNLSFKQLALGNGKLNVDGGRVQTDILTGGAVAINNSSNSARVIVNTRADISSLNLQGNNSRFDAPLAKIGNIEVSDRSYLNIDNLSGGTLTATSGANVRSRSINFDTINAQTGGYIAAGAISGTTLNAGNNSAITANTLTVNAINASSNAALIANTVTAKTIGLSDSASLVADSVTADTLNMEDSSTLAAYASIDVGSATLAHGATLRTNDTAILENHSHIVGGTVEALTELIVKNVIDGDVSEGGALKGEYGVLLEKGVKQYDGTIYAGDRGFITAGKGIGSYEDIDQGTGHLKLDAGMGIYANNITADSVTSRNYNIDTRYQGQAGSITSPLISATKGYIHSGNITAQGSESAPSLVKALQLEAANLTIETGSLQLSGETLNIVDNDFVINDNQNSNFGSMDVTGKSTLTGGSLKANSLASGSSEFTGLDAQIQNLAVNDMAKMSGGSLTGSFFSAGEAQIIDAETNMGTMSVAGKANFSGGRLASDNLTGNDITFTDGIQAPIGSLTLNGAAPNTLSITNTSTASLSTNLTLTSLRLNDGSLLLSSAQGQKAAKLAISKFGKLTDGHSTIYGSVAVGANSMLTSGASNNSWLESLVSGPVSAVAGGAAMAVLSPMRLGYGSSVYVDGGWTQSSGGAPGSTGFGNNSLLAIDGKMDGVRYQGEQVDTAKLPDDVPGAISSDYPIEARIAPEARIYIKGVEAGYTYVALGKNIKTIYEDTLARSTSGGWKGDNLYTDNPLVLLERLEDGKEGQFGVKVLPLPPNVDPGHEDIVKPEPPKPEEPDEPDLPPVRPVEPIEPVEPGPVEPEPIEPVEPVEPEPQLPVVPNNSYLTQGLWLAQKQPQVAAKMLEGSLRMTAISGLPQLVYAANSAAASATTGQRQLAYMADMEKPESPERRPDLALWVTPLYQHLATSGLEAGAFNYDLEGGLGGIALGADLTWANRLRLGMMFHIGAGFAQSGGDLDQTRNNMSFWGAGLYGFWRDGAFKLNGDVGATFSYNKITQDLPRGMDWGSLKADITAWGIGAGLTAGYEFYTPWLTIEPHIGARYFHLGVNSYSINASGGPEVINADYANQDFWTFPAGIAFSHDFEFANGLRLQPWLDGRVVPVAGDKNLNTTVRYAGINKDFDLACQVMDDITYGGSIGVELQAGDFSVGIKYDALFGSHSAINSVFGTLRYEF